MRCGRGQSLVELALCAPIVLLLSLGAVAAVQVADAKAGLDAATRAAAAAAARAPDAISAHDEATQIFESMMAGYPLRSAVMNLALGDFSRADRVSASASGFVDIGWAAMVLPGRVTLESSAVVRLEPWRTHRSPP